MEILKKITTDSEISFISSNNTIYVNKISEKEIVTLPDVLINLLDNNSYQKILVKVPLKFESHLIEKGFYREAYIPHFYNDGTGCSFLSYIKDLDSFINGEYRYIKNRLLELINDDLKFEEEDIDISLSILDMNPKEIKKYLDNLPNSIISEIRNYSNLEKIDHHIKVVYDSNNSEKKPLMILFDDPETSNIEIFEILSNSKSLLSNLIEYAVKYGNHTNKKTIHMLSDIESPTQNFLLKNNFFQYGGTILSKKQDGNPKRNFNVWYKKISGES